LQKAKRQYFKNLIDIFFIISNENNESILISLSYDRGSANSIENSVMDMDIKGLSCDVFSSGIELIKHLQSEQISYNIYLMDIEMPL